MKCLLDQKLIDCKVLENLGYQDGKQTKIIDYKGQEIVVIKTGGRWIKHHAEIQPKRPQR